VLPAGFVTSINQGYYSPDRISRTLPDCKLTFNLQLCLQLEGPWSWTISTQMTRVNSHLLP